MEFACINNNRLSSMLMQFYVLPKIQNGSCKPYVPPMLNLPAHTAALAVKFYQGDMFPPAYAKDTMYIAEVRLISHHQSVFIIASSPPTPQPAAWFLES
jgi:hypothetical protein